MLKDRIALDLPYYDGLLAGHHVKEPGYASRRAGGTDDWLLVFTLTGQGRFGSSLGDLLVDPGSITLVSPGTPHDYGTAKVAERWEILWVHFHPPGEWLEYLHWPSEAPGIATFEPSERMAREIESSFREVFRLCFQPGKRRLAVAMNALERLLLLCDECVPGGGIALDERIRRVVSYIENHLRQDLSLEVLSRLIHLSASRFAHLFRTEAGMSPLQYVSLQRMKRAATLLERTTLSVSEIASEIGMEPFHFSSRFKAQTGQNPRSYRASRMALNRPRKLS